jgi:ribonuclease G
MNEIFGVSRTDEVLINVGIAETRVALMRQGKLEELVLERLPEREEGRAGHSVIGNIYLGQVQRVLPGMQAAFVEVGLERCGFLGAREAACLAELTIMRGDAPPPISACVTEGESILVQAVKDPIGDKGARLSANVTLPGRLLVLVPYQQGVAMSRRVQEGEERDRLQALVENLTARVAQEDSVAADAGYIVRTAAVGASEQDIEDDIRRLTGEWSAILDTQKRAHPPAIVYADLDPVTRSLRDHVKGDVRRVLIDQPKAFARAKDYCAGTMPEMVDRLELYNGPGELFESMGVEAEIESLFGPRVALASGGWITIETTEALTAVDVNSGSYTAATGLEETSLRTNLDACDAVARQLRLRGIGGLIIIDFIHLNEPANIDKVVTRLAENFRYDPVPTQMTGMSEFGVVQVTRKRVREPLSRLLTEDCDACSGHGRMKSRSTVANEILRRLEYMAASHPGQVLYVHAAAPVVAWLETRRQSILTHVRERIAADIKLRVGEGLPLDRYEIVAGHA